MKPLIKHTGRLGVNTVAAALLGTFMPPYAVCRPARADATAKAPVVEKKRTDRDGNGKIDTLEETYHLHADVSLKTTERIDEESEKVQVRVALLIAQGTPFWSEWRLSDNSVYSFIERRCPYGLGFSDTGLVVFDKDRRMLAALNRDESGRLAPMLPDELHSANEMVGGISELMQPLRKAGVDEEQLETE